MRILRTRRGGALSLPRLALFSAALALGGASLFTARALAQDEDGMDFGEEEEGAEGGGAEEPPVDETVRAALREVLTVEHSLRPGNVVDVRYSCLEAGQLEDFEARGFDKCEIGQVHAAGNYANDGVALEIGAGSRGMGALRHRLPLNGDFEIKVVVWVNTNTPSAVMAFTLGKKVAVLWGQAITKSNLKPYNRKVAVDVNEFKEERKATVIMTRKGSELELKFNGRTVDKVEFKKGELDGINFGVVARNMRFVINEISITGVVDTSKL